MTELHVEFHGELYGNGVSVDYISDMRAESELRPSVCALVLAIYAAKGGIPRQPWAFVSLAEELLQESRPSGLLYKALVEARDPKRGFNSEKIFDSFLELTASGLLEAAGAGNAGRLRVSDKHQSSLDRVWQRMSSVDKKSVHRALQRVHANSVALSKMRRASGDCNDGTLTGDPYFRHVSRVRVRAVNS